MENNAENTPVVTKAAEPQAKINNQKGLIATVVIFAILALAGIGFGVYSFIDANNKAAENADLQAKLDLIKSKTGTEVVDTNQDGTVVVETSNDEAVKDIVKQVQEELTSKFGYGRFISTFGDGSEIKIPGTEVITVSDKSYGTYLTLESGIDVESVNASIESVLAKNGFQPNGETFFTQLFYNPNSKIYCSVHGLVDLNCSSETWLSDTKKDLVLELADISGVTIIRQADTEKIENSQVSPYQTWVVEGSNNVEIFYRTSPDSDWQYFTGAQSIIDCSAYNTQDLKNAFAGEMCYDENAPNQTSTVQP